MIRKLPVIIFILLLTCPVFADHTSTTGLSAVILSQQGNIFTWALSNNTGPKDDLPEWDVLLWTLQPEGFPNPQNWTAPTGWEWSNTGGGAFRLLNSDEKYLVNGPSVKPGESVTFTYTVSPLAVPSPEELKNAYFITHVGAVSGFMMKNGEADSWIAMETPNGKSWFDKDDLKFTSPVPEPSGYLAFIIGLIGAFGAWGRRRSNYS